MDFWDNCLEPFERALNGEIDEWSEPFYDFYVPRRKIPKRIYAYQKLMERMNGKKKKNKKIRFKKIS
jgi:hypothetical protein